MADPLSIISAIASVIQLVDFSAKLLSRLNEYRSKGNELPACATQIKRQLPLLREILDQSKLGIESHQITDREAKVIAPCLKGCGEQLDKLGGILSKIVPELQENAMKRMAKGLRSIWKGSEVRDIDGRIGEYVKTLTFYCAWSSSRLDSRNDSIRARLQSWLAAPDPYFNLNRALKLRTPDTGNWYLHGKDYKKWKTGDRLFTWLYGAAGSGKSILSAGIIHDLQQNFCDDPAKALAMWFFDFNDSAKQDPLNMLRSLVRQLLNGCASVPETLQTLHTGSVNAGRTPSAEDLLTALKHVLEAIPRAFVVLDALDECTDRASLFEWLEIMHGWRLPGAHILMTSRKEVDIEEALEDYIPQVAWTPLESNLVDADIRTYVHDRLTRDKAFRRPRWQKATNVQLRGEIEATLARKAAGMFRWARCQLDVLAECTTQGSVRRTLDDLPTDLDETYYRITRAIHAGRHAQEALKILTWLVYSERPLLVDELLEVTGIFLGKKPRFDSDDVLEDPRDILRICSSLVSVTTTADGDSGEDDDTAETGVDGAPEYDHDSDNDDGDGVNVERGSHQADDTHSTGEADNTNVDQVLHLGRNVSRQQHVRLAHFSVREYLASDRPLLSQYRLDIIGSHGMLASSCLVYMLHHYPLNSDVQDGGAPLFKYAASYWGEHARASDETSRLQRDLAVELLMLDVSGLQVAMELALRLGKYGFTFDGLHVASFFGLLGAVTRILENRDIFEVAQSTALHVASCRDHAEIVRLLLDRGADVHMAHKDCTALWFAVDNGCSETVEILLYRGADANTKGEYGEHALRRACRSGYSKIVKLLIDHGADAHLAYQRALPLPRVASFLWRNGVASCLGNGHVSVVKLLLARDAGVNHAGDSLYGTALYAASGKGHLGLVEMLLDHGADVDAPDETFGTALQAASRQGHVSVVNVLLARGADVNHIGGQVDGTALQTASRSGKQEIVKMLLDHGAHPDVHARFRVHVGEFRWRYYYTALQAATSEGYEAIAKMLRDQGARECPCCKPDPDGGFICENATAGSEPKTDSDTLTHEQCEDLDFHESAALQARITDEADQGVLAEAVTACENLAALSLGAERSAPSPDLP